MVVNQHWIDNWRNQGLNPNNVVGINKLFIAHSMCTGNITYTAAFATGTNRAVFSTSKVC